MAEKPTTSRFSAPTARSAARDEWEALMARTYVPLAVDADPEGPFYGRLTTGSLNGPADFSLSTIAGSNQELRRTARHIARSDEEYLLASIQTRGRACLNQDGRSAYVSDGDMVFYDTSRPYNWTNPGEEFEQVVVQIPIALLRRQPGMGRLELPTAVTVPAASAAGVVAGFFRDLARVRDEAPDQAEILASSALDLMGSAVSLTARTLPIDTCADALGREHIMSYLRQRCTDPDLSIDEVARACHISRRTLFRLFKGAGDSYTGTVRKLRVRHAKTLLTREQSIPPALVAFESGFASERTFYRAFQLETGMTPSEYRLAASS
ncbi:helix-turn-helix domain-containing protein [Nocardia sp. NPDC127579]|uniref:helix-turn-helix domain-containing protein n=1 Tax=Nocardia sp. NPDC127579 TaxID=3345402 RepID=UPI00363CD0EB